MSQQIFFTYKKETVNHQPTNKFLYEQQNKPAVNIKKQYKNYKIQERNEGESSEKLLISASGWSYGTCP